MRYIFAAATLALSITAAFAQSQLGTGAISGIVQDPSGAVIASAELTITNVETGLARTVTSGSGGQFSAPVLPPGRYQVRAAKAGFSTLEQNDVVVSVGGTATLTAVLQLGQISETVKVEGSAL